MVLIAYAILLMLLAPGGEPGGEPARAGLQSGRGTATEPSTDRVLTFPLGDKQARILCSMLSRRLGGGDRSLTQWRETSPEHQTPPPSAPGPDDVTTFDLYVPPRLGNKLAGLVVYVSPGDGAALPSAGYREMLAKHNLAWIAGRESGNNHASVWRMYVAAEAARQARTVLDVDEGRIYAAGMSGGGKTACMLGQMVPETFVGTLSFCGPVFYAQVRTDTPNQFLAGFRPLMDAALLAKARPHPFVLITGDNDFNLHPSEWTERAMKLDGFTQVTLTIVPGMKHEHPPVDAFDQALTTLDEAATSGAAKLMATATTLEKQTKLGQALLAYHQAFSRDPANCSGAEPEYLRLKAAYETELTNVRTSPAGADKAKLTSKLIARWGERAKEDLK